jgi:hypothetical protein
MGINRTGATENKKTVQSLQNTSFDQEFGLNAVENLVYNQVTSSIDRMVQPGQTLPVTGLNPSSVLGYDGFNNLTTITKTINGVQYRRTLTYDGSSKLTDITAWVQL